MFAESVAPEEVIASTNKTPYGEPVLNTFTQVMGSDIDSCTALFTEPRRPHLIGVPNIPLDGLSLWLFGSKDEKGKHIALSVVDNTALSLNFCLTHFGPDDERIRFLSRSNIYWKILGRGRTGQKIKLNMTMWRGTGGNIPAELTEFTKDTEESLVANILKFHKEHDPYTQLTEFDGTPEMFHLASDTLLRDL
jgi:hypothetical protein